MHALGHPGSFVLFLYTACSIIQHINFHLSIGQFRCVFPSTNQIFSADKLVRLFIDGSRDQMFFKQFIWFYQPFIWFTSIKYSEIQMILNDVLFATHYKFHNDIYKIIK